MKLEVKEQLKLENKPDKKKKKITSTVKETETPEDTD